MLYIYIFSFIFFLAILFIGGLSAAPYVPTKKNQVNFLLDNISLKPNELILELGCGTGSVLFPMAQKFPQTKFVGFEIAPLPFLISWIKSFKYPNVKVQLKNIFKVNYNQADTIFIFLLDDCYPKLIKKMQSECKNNCQIITEAWALPNITPTKKIKEDNLLSVYFYSTDNLKTQIE